MALSERLRPSLIGLSKKLKMELIASFLKNCTLRLHTRL